MRIALLAALAACHDPYAVPPRDWAQFPAVASLDVSGDIYAVSDIHGGYDRLVTLLTANGLLANGQWTGGNATLVVVGDLFDKGPQGLEVIDLLRTLPAITTLGNHEAEFFADPKNSKADGSDGFDVELAAANIDLMAIADGSDPRGAWLRQRPFAARVDNYFFAHAGATGGRSIAALEQALSAAYDRDDFRDDEFIGDNSILEARDWGTAIPPDVDHVVFGHDPNALGPKGTIAKSGVLFRIDCGMSPDVDYSKGALLHIRTDGGTEQLDSAGNATPL